MNYHKINYEKYGRFYIPTISIEGTFEYFVGFKENVVVIFDQKVKDTIHIQVFTTGNWFARPLDNFQSPLKTKLGKSLYGRN